MGFLHKLKRKTKGFIHKNIKKTKGFLHKADKFTGKVLKKTDDVLKIGGKILQKSAIIGDVLSKSGIPIVSAGGLLLSKGGAKVGKLLVKAGEKVDTYNDKREKIKGKIHSSYKESKNRISNL